MSLQFTVSPDFNVSQISAWYIFNSRLGRILNQPTHLRLFDNFTHLRTALERDEIDLIYANAFDTAYLVREKHFLPVARSSDRSDEALIAVAAGSSIGAVTDFRAPLSVAATNAPDIEMIGRMLLEPADIDQGDVTIVPQPTYVNVAKSVLSGESTAGFFLRESFDELSHLVRSQLKPIVSSHIYVVCHAFLLRPRQAHLKEVLLEGFAAMKTNETDRKTLDELGITSEIVAMSHDEAEFMIDLMNALLP